VAGVPAILARVSFSGELGYEIYVAPPYQLRLAEAIEEAGKDLGLRWYGARTLMSLRLEKAWGVWTLDFRPDFTAAESGLDAFINWDKDFIGKAAASAERKAGPKKKLVTLTIDTKDIDVSNDEAILVGDKAVGYVSSGGYAHHVGKSVAFGYVPTDLAKAGAMVEIEINGARFPAEIQGAPLYDPNGGRMRS
jgi:dimethylglycine dehydrogenase